MSMTQTVTTAAREPIARLPGRLRQNGAAIRCLREKDGWHQPEFARKVGMSQAALSNIELEKRSARPATILPLRVQLLSPRPPGRSGQLCHHAFTRGEKNDYQPSSTSEQCLADSS